jgi:hypothetical protein
MSFQGDVFGLNSVYDKQVENVDNNNFESWPESNNYGYIMGGYIPPNNYTNTIERLDFSSETVSSPGNNLPEAKTKSVGTSNSLYGYIIGGASFSPPPSVYYNTILRLDFSSETVSDPGNNLPAAKFNLAEVSNNLYGYLASASNVPPSPTESTVFRLDFSNETISTPGKNLPSGRFASSGVSSISYGYFAGGGDTAPPYLCTISRLDFTNETISDPGNNLSFNRTRLASVSFSSYGYFGGGDTYPGSPPVLYYSIIERLDFSNEMVSSPGKNLPIEVSDMSGVSSNSFGYYCGGTDNLGNTINTIRKLDFFNETVSNSGQNLPTTVNGTASVSGGTSIYRSKGFKTYGYYAGGTKSPSPPYNTSSIERIDFSTENVNVISAKVSSAVSGLHGVSNNYYGYFSGGNAVGVGNYSYVTRLDFSNETTKQLSNAPDNIVSTVPLSNSQYGYIYSLNTSDIVRFDYSAETYLLLNSKTLSNRFGSATGSHGSYGYVMSGGYRSSIERLDFSNESVTELSSTIPYAAAFAAGTSNNSYLYLGGGSPNGSLQDSRVARLDFSTENVSLPGYPISPARYSVSGTSANYYGYFAGGYGPLSNNTISRLDFSSETTQNPGKNLSLFVTSMIGIENSN